MRVLLSGMPELRLGLNDKILFQTYSSACFSFYAFQIVFVFKKFEEYDQTAYMLEI